MEIEEWVEEKMEAGKPEEEIRRELSESGWSDEDIDRTIRQAKVGRRGRDSVPGPRKEGGGMGSWRNRLQSIALFLVSAIIGFLIVTALTKVV